MNRLVQSFAILFVLFPASRLLGIDVCLINDSDRTAIVTVISGTDHFEKRLKPKSHVFVSLVDSKDDRVVIAQTVDETNADKSTWTTKVVDTKVIAEQVNRLSFCYLHEEESSGLKMDLLAYVCLDIVPQQWGKEPSNERFEGVKAKLIRNMTSTEEIEPESSSNLKKYVRQFVLLSKSPPTSR